MSKFFEECREKYKGKEIAIIGNGPSMMRCLGDSREFAIITSAASIKCPIWTVNGGWFHWKSEIGFMMDDFKYMISEKGETENMKFCEKLLSEAEIPIVTSTPYQDIAPTSVAFPLANVLKKIPFRLYHETIHYMLALAIACGVKRIQLHGCDYTASDRFPWERAGTEAWIFAAFLKGIEVAVSDQSNLLKMQRTDEKHLSFFDAEYYGYKKDSNTLNVIRSLADSERFNQEKYA